MISLCGESTESNFDDVLRTLQECLREHGGGKVGQTWFDGDVPLFLVSFQTRMALKKLLTEKSILEEKLMNKLWGELRIFLALSMHSRFIQASYAYCNILQC